MSASDRAREATRRYLLRQMLALGATEAGTPEARRWCALHSRYVALGGVARPVRVAREVEDYGAWLRQRRV